MPSKPNIPMLALAAGVIAVAAALAFAELTEAQERPIIHLVCAEAEAPGRDGTLVKGLFCKVVRMVPSEDQAPRERPSVGDRGREEYRISYPAADASEPLRF